MNQHGNGKYGKAFDYPEVSSKTSSQPPSDHINNQVNAMNQKQNNIINLTEGRTTKLVLEGGASSIDYMYIIDPRNFKPYSVSSNKGKNLLKRYLKMFLQ